MRDDIVLDFLRLPSLSVISPTKTFPTFLPYVTADALGADLPLQADGSFVAPKGAPAALELGRSCKSACLGAP